MAIGEVRGSVEVRQAILLGFMFSVLAMGLGAIGTVWGIGLTPDSVLYLEMAESIARGDGIPTVLMENEQGSVYPPLYPLALAAAGAGFESFEAARWLQIFFFGLNVLLCVALLRKVTGGVGWPMVGGAFLITTSLTMMEIHTAAWSEAVFLLCTLATLLALSAYLESPSPGRLVVAGLLAGIIPLARYVGAAFIVSGFVVVMLWGRRGWRDRILFAVLSSLPLATLLVWNRFRFGSAEAHGDSVHLYWPGPDLVMMTNVVAAWLVPGIDRFTVLPFQDLVSVSLTAAWLVALWKLGRHREITATPLSKVLAVFSVGYPLVLLTIIVFLRNDVPVDQRMLGPVHLTLLIFSVGVLAAARDAGGTSTRRFWSGILLVWCLVYLAPALYGARFLVIHGRGYLGPNYRAPKIYQSLRESRDEKIYSNERRATRVWLNRTVDWLRPEVDGPVLFFRVGHPLPPRHEAGSKRPTEPSSERLEHLIRTVPLDLVMKEGMVELYRPRSKP